MENRFYFLLIFFCASQLICMDVPTDLVLVKKNPNASYIHAVTHGDLDTLTILLAATDVDLNKPYYQITNCNVVVRTHFGCKFETKECETINPDRNTLLMRAACLGRVPIVRRLLQAGAKPDEQNKQGHTAITLCNKHTTVLNALLEGNANPNIRTFLGNTALIYSIMKKDSNQTGLLLCHGADASIRNDSGFSAEDYARMAGKEFVELLSLFIAQTTPDIQMLEVVVENQNEAETQQEV